ncbi:MAG: replication factor C large subunit [Methanomicrobiales archaeon]
MWTEKYRPKNLDEIAGNLKAKKEISEWIDNWKEENPQKCLMLVGPPGTGKTTIAHIIASEFTDYIELNASDKRSYDVIMNTIGEASATRSLFNKGYKVIILDEVDGIHGRDDRGGARAINKIIKEGKHPVVMTANDPYSKRIKSIKPKCKVINIKNVHTNSIAAYLRRICEKEGLKCEGEVLKNLAKRSSGDLRSAINDLELMAKGQENITSEDLETISQKDEVSNIFDSVRTVLKSKNIRHVKDAMHLDEDPKFVFELITENIPKEYEKNYEIEKAYDMISLADINFGRAFNTRDYTYWRYSFDLMGLGVALAKDDTYRKFTRYGSSSVYSLLSKSRSKRDLKDRVAQKFGEKLHISKKEAIYQFPYYEFMFQDDETAYDLVNYFDLDDAEVKLFRSRKIKVKKSKQKKKSKKIPKQKDDYGSTLYSNRKTKKSSKKPEKSGKSNLKEKKPKNKKSAIKENIKNKPVKSKKADKDKNLNSTKNKEKKSEKKDGQSSLFSFN